MRGFSVFDLRVTEGRENDHFLRLLFDLRLGSNQLIILFIRGAAHHVVPLTTGQLLDMICNS